MHNEAVARWPALRWQTVALRMRGRLRDLLREVIGPSRALPRRWRMACWVASGIRIGEGSRVEHGQHFANDRVTLGSRCYVNEGCHFDAGDAYIEVGDDVNIGTGVVLAAASHEIGPGTRRARGWISRPIVVGDGCWLGARVVVLPGVTIGRGCVIGAGSVVTKDTEPDGLYVGAPARRLRDLAV